MAQRVGAIVGPTGVGKTEVSLALAPLLGAEIVSIDSMQIYRGMDIGTAKPSSEARRTVPHHLIDVFDPSTEVTVSEFQKLGRAAIADIAVRGRQSLLVGGSGLHFRAVVDDLRFPPRSPLVRDALETEIDTQGAEALHQRLMTLDPVAGQRIEPGNARRIVRALEVIEVTGRLFSENDAFDKFESIYHLRVAGLTMPRDALFERLARRIDEMLERGLVDEVQELESTGYGRTASQALGYRQILEAGPGASTQSIRDDILAATKRFVRRQESWFRSDPRVNWFDATTPALIDHLVVFFRWAS
jgi:tRNA dimethylallyltransferase